VTTDDLPHIPAGILLRLRAGEWRDCPNTPTRLPSDELMVVVVRVYSQPVGGMVWLRGHLPGCALDDCPEPCVEGQVSVTALREHAEGRQG
jgi:hypothetical protein